MTGRTLRPLISIACLPLLACGARAPSGDNGGPGAANGGTSAGTGTTSGSGGGGATTVGGSLGQAGAGAGASSSTAGIGGKSDAAGGASGGGSGGAGTAGAGGAPPSCQNGKVVHFSYFVESDAVFSESQRADIEQQAFAFQQYWFDQLGVTFYLSYPVVTVIEADHDANWYLTTPDGLHGDDERWYRLGNVSKEVRAKLDIMNNPNRRVVNYPTSRHDGRVGANFAGAWMDGDDLSCIAEGGFNYPYDDQNSAHCLGHVAHEFGHILGLDHEGPNDDCMQFGFYTNDADELCSFSTDNVAKILANPDNAGWFEALPGETCTGG
jgi:hypothetical protein